MKKIFFYLSIPLIIFLISLLRSPSKYRSVAALQSVSTTATIQPARTPIPSATVDYQATLMIAQQTADEARRVNAQVTAEFEQRAYGQLQMTAESDKRNQQIYTWTITAALTAIPLTETQQAIHNAQVDQQLAIQSGLLTATKEAPTQMVAMANAQMSIALKKTTNIVGIFAEIAIGIFAIGLIIYLFRLPVSESDSASEQSQATQEASFWTKDTANGSYNLTRHEIQIMPCSESQLTELAELVLNGEKTLGINRLEKNSRTLRPRRLLYHIRAFFLDHKNKFATEAGSGELAVTEAGESFLRGWFDEHILPVGYRFETPLPDSTSSQENTEIMGENNHNHDNHVIIGGGGGGLLELDEVKS